MKHGTTTTNGFCRDCASGLLIPAERGFEYFDEEGDGQGFWFCRYCGSNHVTITLDDGTKVMEQGDLYETGA